MNSEVESILNLQNLDLEIINKSLQIDRIPLEIKNLNEKKDRLQEDLKEFEEKIKNQMMKQKGIEGQIEDYKAKLQKYEVQLNTVKTNDEYSAILKEISGTKQKITDVEDDLLEIMEVTENFEGSKKEKMKELDEKKSLFEEQIQEKNNDFNKLKKEVEVSLSERELASKKCDGQLFKRYEKFMEKKKSIALVPVEKHGACSGCHRNLPPNIKNEVMKGKILQCDNCSRLLFWQVDKKEEVTTGESDA